MNNEYSIAAHWPGGFDEAGLRDWAENLRAATARAAGFARPRFHVAEIFPARAGRRWKFCAFTPAIPLLAGCSSTGLIAGAREIENASGLVLALYSLPGAELKGVRFTQSQVEEAERRAYWPLETGVEPKQHQRLAGLSLTRFTSTRKAGFAPGTKPMPGARALAGWPAAFLPTRPRRFI